MGKNNKGQGKPTPPPEAPAEETAPPAEETPVTELTDEDSRQVDREEREALAKYDVDEFAKGVFEAMKVELTAALAKAYCEFKALKNLAG